MAEVSDGSSALGWASVAVSAVGPPRGCRADRVGDASAEAAQAIMARPRKRPPGAERAPALEVREGVTAVVPFGGGRWPLLRDRWLDNASEAVRPLCGGAHVASSSKMSERLAEDGRRC